MGSIGQHPPHGFSILIIGAGIAGLAAAVPLAQYGHKVTVLEAKPALNEFGASIGILANGVKVLKAWGLEEEFNKVVTKNGCWQLRNSSDGELLGEVVFNKGNMAEILYNGEVWNIHRADYQQTLAKAAMDKGAEILFNAHTVDVNTETNTVILEDGRRLQADLIIGADGLRSAVRHSIPAVSDIPMKVLYEQCFRCTVPKSTMWGHPELEWLLTCGDEQIWMAPDKYILSWPLPDNRPYDVVCCVVRESDVPPGKWGVKADARAMAEDFKDFCPTVTELLARVDGCVKWTLAELPPLSTCRSENGQAVLIGDAWHSMIPHSASGGNSAIEDAAVIGECINWAHKNGEDIAKATEAFEKLRKPRVERMQIASHEGYKAFSADPDFIPIRNKMLKDQMAAQNIELALPESERRAKPLPEADMNAPFPSAPYLQWLYQYDGINEARAYLAKL